MLLFRKKSEEQCLDEIERRINKTAIRKILFLCGYFLFSLVNILLFFFIIYSKSLIPPTIPPEDRMVLFFVMCVALFGIFLSLKQTISDAIKEITGDRTEQILLKYYYMAKGKGKIGGEEPIE